MFAQVTDTASAFLEIGKQVPSLVVLCVLTYLFLKQMGEARSEYLASLKMMHDENLEARTVSRSVIKDNTIATQDMTVALTKLVDAVGKLE